MDGIGLGIVALAGIGGVVYYLKKKQKEREAVISLIDEILEESSLDKIKAKVEKLKEALDGNSVRSDLKTYFNEILLAVRTLEQEAEKDIEKIKAELRDFRRRFKEE